MSIFFDSLFEEKDLITVFANSPMIAEFNLSKQFVMKDIGVTPRVFHHWASKGFIDMRPMQSGLKHEFSFVELVWFNIVNELREFGFSLDKIKVVHDSLMEKFDYATYINSLSEVERQKMIDDVDLLPSQFDEHKSNIKETMKEDFNNPGLPSDDDEDKIYALYFFLYAFLIYRCNVWIYIDNSGTVIPYIEKVMDKAKLKQFMEDYSFDSESYICISLVKFFRKFVQNPKHLDFVKDNGILNENEQIILSLIRDGKAKAITIRFEADKPRVLEISEERKLYAASRLSDILLNKGYQSIVIKTQNGDISFTNITTKIKLKLI